MSTVFVKENCLFGGKNKKVCLNIQNGQLKQALINIIKIRAILCGKACHQEYVR